MADTLTADTEVSPALKDDPGAYFQAWYPIHVSASLTQGQLIGRDFLGTRVILYRDKDGRAVVQSAYCPHLGADLSQGELIGGEVRCPYHHWQFGADGKCTKIPPQPNIPAAARIYNYPTEEKWGLVWAFNGPEALYPVPGVLDVDDSEIQIHAYEQGERRGRCWVSTSNAVDFQHLDTVHNLKGNEPLWVKTGPYQIDIRTDSPERTVDSRVSGVSVFSMIARHKDDRPDRIMVAGNHPITNDRNCAFVCVGIRKSDIPKLGPDWQQHLENYVQHAIRLAEEDGPILANIRIRPRGTAALIGADRHLARFLRYIEEFPRARPFDT